MLGDLDTPAPELAGRVVDLSFADEQSVVQTRFATSALMLFRAAWRSDVEGLADAAAEAVTAPLDPAWAAAEQKLATLNKRVEEAKEGVSQTGSIRLTAPPRRPAR